MQIDAANMHQCELNREIRKASAPRLAL